MEKPKGRINVMHSYDLEDLLLMLGLRNSEQLAQSDYQEMIRDFLLRTSQRTVWDPVNATYVPQGWEWNPVLCRYEPGSKWNSVRGRYEIGDKWNPVRGRYEIGSKWDPINAVYVPSNWKWNSLKGRYEYGTRWNPLKEEYE